MAPYVRTYLWVAIYHSVDGPFFFLLNKIQQDNIESYAKFKTACVMKLYKQ